MNVLLWSWRIMHFLDRNIIRSPKRSKFTMKEEKINRSDQHTFTWLFLGGLIASDCFLIRIMAYSEVVKYWHQPSTLPRLTYESPEHKEDTGQHPGLYCRQTLGLRGVGGDRVEDVDQHQEQGHKERHPARDDVRRNDKATSQEFYCCFNIRCFYLKVWEVCFRHK